jgi:hypothetical protein
MKGAFGTGEALNYNTGIFINEYAHWNLVKMHKNRRINALAKPALKQEKLHMQLFLL